ncbi:MAG: AMP-binding protein [Bdellovibrionota bacterium]
MERIHLKRCISRSLATAAALNKYGVQGKRCYSLKNCASWIISDLAIWMAGGVSVPFLPTYSQETLQKIIVHSDVSVIFCGKLDNWKSIQKIIPENLLCIHYPDFPLEGTTSWNDFINNNPNHNFTPIKRKPEELATITYTSGSTGAPKGVMHNFAALSFTGVNVASYFSSPDNNRNISYLPIGHVAERALNELAPIYAHDNVSFVETQESFSRNIQEVEPNVFLAVPRIWHKLQAQILKQIPQKKLSVLLAIPIVSGIIKKKIKKKMGLLKARYYITGTAPIAPSLVEWFGKLDILIRDGYGMTETFAYAYFSLQEKVKQGSVGQPLKGVETKLSPTGELLIKSPSNMMGFYKCPEMDKDAFEGDYIKTGDLARFDEENYAYITGRCKEIFKTAKGKYIVPVHLESKLLQSNLIENVCVMGSGLEAPYAFINLSEERNNREEKEITDELASFLINVNKQLESHEKISKVLISAEVWTIEAGFLTPTLKIKRSELEKFYEPKLLKIKDTPGRVLFLTA